MDEIAQRIRRVTRPWRSVFAAYASALIIGTHWPGLTLSPEGPSDKIIHFTAFGLLPLLLWQTRWIGRLSTIVLLCLAWGILDELSQGIPALNRSVTWQDASANSLGVIAMSTWIWTMRPVGKTGNRVRLKLHQYVMEEIFAQRKAWFVLVGALMACAAPVALTWPILTPSDRQTPLMIATLVWVSVTLLIWTTIWKSHYRGVLSTRQCFDCSATAINVELDEYGGGRCETCDAALHAGHWLEPAPPTSKTLIRIAIGPILLGVGILFSGILLLAGAVWTHDRLIAWRGTTPWLPNPSRVMGTERELMTCVDLTVLLAIFALCTRVYRARLARHYDRPFLCRQCGHDLRGTPTSRGAGRCGECGTQFVRPPGQRSAAFDEA